MSILQTGPDKNNKNNKQDKNNNTQALNQDNTRAAQARTNKGNKQ